MPDERPSGLPEAQGNPEAHGRLDTSLKAGLALPEMVGPTVFLCLKMPDFESAFAQEYAEVLAESIGEFGRPTSYQRPGFAAFEIVGITKSLARLEDVNRGQFNSISYQLTDFDAAPFTASVTVRFGAAPATNGTLVFDGVNYTSKGTLDNSVPNQFDRGVSAFSAAENLAAAINAGAGAGTAYSAATVPHPTCFATVDPTNGSWVIVSARVTGQAGDLIEALDDMRSVSLDSQAFECSISRLIPTLQWGHFMFFYLSKSS